MKHPTLLNFLIFTCFLVVGYTLSTRLYHDVQAINSKQVSAGSLIGSGPIQALNNGQYSILLVGVDTLNTSKPQLISLWQVSYLPSNPILYMYPIYPVGKASPTNFEKSIIRAFSIDQRAGSLVLDQDFIRLLVDNNYSWDGYFIYDLVALSEMVYTMGNAQTDLMVNKANNKLLDLSNFGRNPQDTFSTQVAVMQMTCQYIATMRKDIDWPQWMSLAPDHVFSDMNLQENYTEWKTEITDEQSLNCRFPTLEFSRSEN